MTSYEIHEKDRQRAPLYDVEDIHYEARLSGRAADPTKQLRSMFQDIVDLAGEEYEKDDKVRVVVQHSELSGTLLIPLQSKWELTADNIMDK